MSRPRRPIFSLSEGQPRGSAPVRSGHGTHIRRRYAAIASAYDFARFEQIVDLGGGRGGLLVQILKRAPKATGVLFEQPQVLATATRLDDAGLSRRSKKVAGDFLASVPEGADYYVIKGVLHDFNDQQRTSILSKCRRAAGVTSRLVIVNQDLPGTIDAPHPNLIMDIQMMTLLGGRERSVSVWSGLFQQSGWKFGIQIETSAGFALVEGKPNQTRQTDQTGNGRRELT